MSNAAIDRPAAGEQSAAISNLIVRLVSEYTGRGPTKARTYLNDEVITVVLQEVLTKAERSLARDGKRELVLSTRLAFQQTMREDFIAGVEEITGGKVRAFLSSNHLDPDIAVETFVLEAPPNGDAGR